MYHIRLRPEAETDLQFLYQGLVERGASPATARGYVNRILGYVNALDVFPKRGSVHDEVRPGLRVIGFARHVSIAFVVVDEAQEVIILRILYSGQQLTLSDE